MIPDQARFPLAHEALLALGRDPLDRAILRTHLLQPAPQQVWVIALAHYELPQRPVRVVRIPRNIEREVGNN